MILSIILEEHSTSNKKKCYTCLVKPIYTLYKLYSLYIKDIEKVDEI